jgi:hypothetical protein
MITVSSNPQTRVQNLGGWRCPDCGAIWENLVEGGAGGHGNFWNRIDPPEQK